MIMQDISNTIFNIGKDYNNILLLLTDGQMNVLTTYPNNRVSALRRILIGDDIRKGGDTRLIITLVPKVKVI